MKKLLLTVLLACMPMLAFSQENVSYPSYNHSVITNTFLDNWFVEMGWNSNVFYPDQLHGVQGKRSYTRNGLSMALGKWATHEFAARFMVSQWSTTRTVGQQELTKNTWSFQLLPMFNVTQFLLGYKPRMFDLSLFGGAGLAVNRGGVDEVTDHVVSMITTLGVRGSFRITPRLHANVDVMFTSGEAKLDGITGPAKDKFSNSHDRLLRFGIGLSYSIGKHRWQKAPDMGAVQSIHQAEIDALNLTIEELEAENERLRSSVGDTEPEFEIPEAPEVDD